MRVTVQLDPSEQVCGQPPSAEVTVRPESVRDLLTLAREEARNVYLPAGWSENTAAVVAARLLAGGLGLGVPVVMDAAAVRSEPLRLHSPGESNTNRSCTTIAPRSPE